MIRVIVSPEYPSFDADVRRPGKAFLASCPEPNSDQFKKKNLWTRAAGQLHIAYSGICAYTAMYLPEQGTVDHFLPKTAYPAQAYEWSNFRLASGRINTYKGNSTDIVDPFVVDNDWFHLDLPGCLLKPNPGLEQAIRDRVTRTIKLLRLNQDDNYVQGRCDILMDFARGDVSIGFLQRRYPFLAKEVSRQALASDSLRRLFGF